MKKTEAKTFEPLRDIRPHALREGITARAVEGERMTMAVVDLEPNIAMPEHHHENEQLGFIIAGSMTMWIGDEKSDLRPGDTYAIPSDVSHHVVVGSDGCTVVDVFAPVREDWKKLERLEPTKPSWP